MNSPLKRYGSFYLRYVTPLRRRVALLSLLILATIGLQLVNPQIIRYFIDTALAAGTGGAQTANLMGAAITFLVTALCLQGVSVTAVYLGEDIGWRATNQLRADLALHCLRLDMSFHNSHKPGEMIERIDGDVMDIAVFFAQFVVRVIGNLLLLLGVIIVLLWTDWRISLALTVYTLFSLACFYYLRKKAVPFWEANRQAAADLFGFLEETLSGTEDIRSSGARRYALRNLFKFAKARLDREIKGGDMDIIFVSMWFVLYTLGQGVAFITGYWLFQQGAITVGTVYLIIYYTDRILQPLNEITEQFQNVQKAAAGINRVESLYAISSKVVDEGQQHLPQGALTVHFDDVTFGYVTEEPVLRNVSFTLPQGRVLGLLGRTGSGKTTITRLLYRLYDPTAGAIQLGGSTPSYLPPSLSYKDEGRNGEGPEEESASIKPSAPFPFESQRTAHGNGDQIYHLGASPCQDIRTTPLANLRSRIGMVTQEVQLFKASVRDNLTFFNPEISDERIMAVIHALELTEWYNRLPQGLETELQAEGSSLSAGEAQLLAFTRVFLQDPGLVILDEASSRLDPATERLIERAIDKLLHNRTGIIVAHRLATIQRADDILILQDGQIQEHGLREHLASDPQSRFAQLLQTGLEKVLV